MAPDPPFVPSAARVKTLLWATLWASLSSLEPLAITVIYDIQQNEFTDWNKLMVLMLATAGTGAIKYWRKHEAWLKQPPE